MKKIYCLTAEDLTHLGSSMGTEYTTTSIVGYFFNIEDAKKEAQKQYGKPSINWKKVLYSKDKLTSGDLLWVMYEISIIKVK